MHHGKKDINRSRLYARHGEIVVRGGYYAGAGKVRLMMSPPPSLSTLLLQNVLINVNVNISLPHHLSLYCSETKIHLPHKGRKSFAGMLLAPKLADREALDTVKVSVDQCVLSFLFFFSFFSLLSFLKNNPPH